MTAGKEYGKALFMLAEECSETERMLSDVLAADEIFRENPRYVKLLDTPAISKEEKHTLLDKSIGSLS